MAQPRERITIEVIVRAPLQTVWERWTEPRDIERWNAASDDWHTTRATNDLRVGGSFSSRMEAKDGSAGFDFGGTYAEVVPNARIASLLGDGRTVEVSFAETPEGVRVVETFEAEGENPVELQRQGWRAILDRFKKYVEETAAAA